MKIAFSAKNYLCGLDNEFVLPMPAKNDTYTIGGKKDAYDDLMMSATLIDDGGMRSFLVTLDISFVRPLLVDHIYDSIHMVAPEFKKENLFINASHNHIGPVYSKDQYAANHMPGEVESDYNLFLELVLHWSGMAAQMYTECAANLTEFYADIASVALEGCFSSREGLDAPCDKNATIVRFFDCETNQQIGMWLNMSCHSVYHPDLGVIGPDLLGGTAKKLQSLYGVYAQPFAGCQGNTSTKHTGRRTTGIEDSIEEMNRVAEKIVEQIHKKAIFEKVAMDTSKVRNLALTYDYDSRHGVLAASVVSLGQLKIAMFNGELKNTMGPILTSHEGNIHHLVTCYVNGQMEYQLDEDVKNDASTVPAGLASVIVNMVRAKLADCTL